MSAAAAADGAAGLQPREQQLRLQQPCHHLRHRRQAAGVDAAATTAVRCGGGTGGSGIWSRNRRSVRSIQKRRRCRGSVFGARDLHRVFERPALHHGQRPQELWRQQLQPRQVRGYCKCGLLMASSALEQLRPWLGGLDSSMSEAANLKQVAGAVPLASLARNGGGAAALPQAATTSETSSTAVTSRALRRTEP